MDQNKVTDYLFLLKLLVDSQETLFEYQSKVDTMLQVVLEKDLIEYPRLKLHIYMQALTESVYRAISFTEDVMSVINEITSLMMRSQRDRQATSMAVAGKLEEI